MFKTYTSKGMFVGIIAGIVLSLLGIIIVYSCNFVFNPGGSYPPAGVCEIATKVYFPVAIFFFVSPLFGLIGSIIPLILLTVISAGIGTVFGRLIQKKAEKGSLSNSLRITVVGIIIIFFTLILISMAVIYADRKKEIDDMANDYKTNFEAKMSAPTPEYLPNGLKKIPLGNEAEEGEITYIYGCEKDNSSSYSLEIKIEPLNNVNAHISPYSPWRTHPEYRYKEESISIGRNSGYFYYFEENSDNKDWDYQTYAKYERGIYWNDGNKYFEINNKTDAACVFSLEELIKIAESMR